MLCCSMFMWYITSCSCSSRLKVLAVCVIHVWTLKLCTVVIVFVCRSIAAKGDKKTAKFTCLKCSELLKILFTGRLSLIRPLGKYLLVKIF